VTSHQGRSFKTTTATFRECQAGIATGAHKERVNSPTALSDLCSAIIVQKLTTFVNFSKYNVGKVCSNINRVRCELIFPEDMKAETVCLLPPESQDPQD